MSELRIPTKELSKLVCSLVNKKAGSPFPKKAVIIIGNQCCFATFLNARKTNGKRERKAINSRKAATCV